MILCCIGFLVGLGIGIVIALIVNRSWHRMALSMLRDQERKLRRQIYEAFEEGKKAGRRKL